MGTRKVDLPLAFRRSAETTKPIASMRSSPPTTERMLVASCPLKFTNPKPRGAASSSGPLGFGRTPQLAEPYHVNDHGVAAAVSPKGFVSIFFGSARMRVKASKARPDGGHTPRAELSCSRGIQGRLRTFPDCGFALSTAIYKALAASALSGSSRSTSRSSTIPSCHRPSRHRARA